MTDQDRSFALEFRLRELDPALHKRFTDCVFALQKILSNYKLIFPEYTDHTEMHSISVIDFCRRIIGDQLDKLNRADLYVLLLGCYFHDTGMGITKKDFEEFSCKIDFGDYFKLHPDASIADQIRDFHHVYSGLFVRKYADFFEFPSREYLEAVIQVSRGHRKTDLLDENAYPIDLVTPEGDNICVPYLAALVRLSDEIDITSARSSVLLYDLESMTDAKQIGEHLRHRAIRDLIVGEDAFTLVYDPSNLIIDEKIEQLAKKMNRALAQCREAVNGRTPFVITQREVRLRPL